MSGAAKVCRQVCASYRFAAFEHHQSHVAADKHVAQGGMG